MPRLGEHVAAVLYGVGARMDHTPEMLFALRGVDHLELVSQAGGGRRTQTCHYGAPRSEQRERSCKAPTAMRKPTPSRKSKQRAPTITARELIVLSVPRSTFQNWVTSGVLVRTDQRGVYRTTADTQQSIDQALRKRPRSKQRK